MPNPRNPSALALYEAEARRHPILSPERIAELGRLAYRGDIAARNEIVVHFLRLAVAFARAYKGMGVEQEDLIQQANIGLIEAAKHYDPDNPKGASFSTYARGWMLRFVLEEIARQGRSVRLSMRAASVANRFRSVSWSFVEEHGREPSRVEAATRVLQLEFEKKNGRAATPDEIDERLDQYLVWGELMRHVEAGELRLDATPSRQGQFESGHRHELADDAPGALDSIEEREAGSLLDGFINRLDVRRQQAVRLNIGLGRFRPHTHEAVGEELGVGKARARQLFTSACEQLAEQPDIQLLAEAFGWEVAPGDDPGTSGESMEAA